MQVNETREGRGEGGRRGLGSVKGTYLVPVAYKIVLLLLLLRAAAVLMMPVCAGLRVIRECRARPPGILLLAPPPIHSLHPLASIYVYTQPPHFQHLLLTSPDATLAGGRRRERPSVDDERQQHQQ